MVESILVLREEKNPPGSLWLLFLCLGSREFEIYTDAEDDKEKALAIVKSISESLKIRFVEEREHVCYTVAVDQ